MKDEIYLSDKIDQKTKELLKRIARDVFGSCQGFLNDIDQCQTFNALNNVFRRSAEDIAEKLGVEIIDPDDYDELEHENSRIQKELNEYESKEWLTNASSGSLIDEWRSEILHKYIPPIPPMELEEKL